MRKYLPFVYLNNKIVPRESAQIPIVDPDFQNGKGVFTTLKVRQSIPLFLSRHIHRLRSNAQTIKIEKIPADLELENAIHTTIKKNNLIDGGLRMTLTPLTLEAHAFTCAFEIKKVPVITVPDTRDKFKTSKLTYRLHNDLALKKAEKEGAQDALFTTPQNLLIESTYANIFKLSTNKSIITPSIEGEGLNGITRQVLMENLPILEKDIPADTTDPIILTSSLTTRIVESIDGKEIKQSPEFVATILNARETAELSYLATIKK